jgi:hypothetical protein
MLEIVGFWIVLENPFYSRPQVRSSGNSSKAKRAARTNRIWCCCDCNDRNRIDRHTDTTGTGTSGGRSDGNAICAGLIGLDVGNSRILDSAGESIRPDHT